MGSRQPDADGYRPNVGVVLANNEGQVLWARRHGDRGWQFPQGGIDQGESPTDALFRELTEEVGLAQDKVQLVASTSGWLRYKVPGHNLPVASRRQGFIGQKQRWFLLKLIGDEADIRLDTTVNPEFDRWRWVSYWYPLNKVVYFKQEVYRLALKHLATEISWVN